jgi:hypothetical protein|mmetsp:Transcript_56198/g.93409  ORF Transcript_56198/g.93409 Transcript_56198/m.93409 type:complete len:201 (+) Transcript_56198:366-968(+)
MQCVHRWRGCSNCTGAGPGGGMRHRVLGNRNSNADMNTTCLPVTPVAYGSRLGCGNGLLFWGLQRGNTDPSLKKLSEAVAHGNTQHQRTGGVGANQRQNGLGRAKILRHLRGCTEQPRAAAQRSNTRLRSASQLSCTKQKHTAAQSRCPRPCKLVTRSCTHKKLREACPSGDAWTLHGSPTSELSTSVSVKQPQAQIVSF